MKKVLSLLMIVLGSLPVIVGGQEEHSDWEVALLDLTGQQIIFVNANGLSERFITLPSELYQYEIDPALHSHPQQPLVAVSPDLRYLAFRVTAFTSELKPITQIIMADLVTGSCCIVAQSPVEGYDEVTLGTFSPDGRQLAVVFARLYAQSFESKVAIVDSATGEVLRSSNTHALVEGNNLYLGAWTEEGILLHPSCFACEGVWNGRFSLWNPEANTVQPTQYYFSIAGERLEETGEFVEAITYPDYPTTYPQGSMIPAYNAIGYYAEGYPSEGLPPIVFNGSDYVDWEIMMPTPRWVYDGQAILIPAIRDTPLTVVFRDGTIVTQIDTSGNSRFLAGTSDGWLMQDQYNGILHYRITEEHIIELTTIAPITDPVHVLSTPSLGAGIEPGFAIIE